MEVARSYTQPSVSIPTSSGSRFSLATDLSRPGVFLDASVRCGVPFSRAMLALHRVVRSDLRAQERDHSAYQKWVQQEYLKELPQVAAERAAGLPALLEKHAKLLQEINSLKPEAEQMYKLPSYWEAERRFKHWLWHVNGEVADVLYDPVVSVQPDAVFFEVFSLDESSYGRVSLPESELEHALGQQRGTTNVDFSEGLAREFSRVRSYRPLKLQVGHASVSIGTEAGAAVEKKIDLPESWVRGFLEVQSAATLPSSLVTLSAATVADILFLLKQNRERQSPRSLRFHLRPGERPEIELEPWGFRVREPRYEYAGDVAAEIRVWGRRRLFVLEDLLPDADTVEVRLLGTGMPSFWSLAVGPVRLDIGLSGWTVNDWASQARFEALAATGSADAQAETRLAGILKGSAGLSVAEAASQSGLDRQVANKGLQALCRGGKAMYDAHADIYRWRELFRPGEIPPEDTESKAVISASKLVDAGEVSIGERLVSDDGGEQIVAEVGKDNVFEVQLTTDADGRVSRAHCSCGTFRMHKLRKGPCRHLLATLLKAGQS